MITFDHTWSHLITNYHTWSHLITFDHKWSHLITLDQNSSQLITDNQIRPHHITLIVTVILWSDWSSHLITIHHTQSYLITLDPNWLHLITLYLLITLDHIWPDKTTPNRTGCHSHPKETPCVLTMWSAVLSSSSLPSKFAFGPVISICRLSLLSLSLRCEHFALSTEHSHPTAHSHFTELRKLIIAIRFLQLLLIFCNSLFTATTSFAFQKKCKW